MNSIQTTEILIKDGDLMAPYIPEKIDSANYLFSNLIELDFYKELPERFTTNLDVGIGLAGYGHRISNWIDLNFCFYQDRNHFKMHSTQLYTIEDEIINYLRRIITNNAVITTLDFSHESIQYKPELKHQSKEIELIMRICSRIYKAYKKFCKVQDKEFLNSQLYFSLGEQTIFHPIYWGYMRAKHIKKYTKHELLKCMKMCQEILSKYMVNHTKLVITRYGNDRTKKWKYELI